MRKQELDNWIENGGELPDELTEDEKNYLKGLGWECLEKWEEDGQKYYEKYLLNGYFHGVFKEWCTWHGDGHLSEVERYLNGEKHGRQDNWYDSGQKFYEENYHHGKEHGVWRTWYSNGHKEYEGCYHYGKEHGVFKAWDEDDGTLEEHKEYAYGVLLKDHLKEETK